MTKKSDSSWFQFDSNVLCTVNYINKRKCFKISLLCYLPRPFCVAHAHWKPNQRNQNFMILADSLDGVMYIYAEFESNRVNRSH